MLTVKDTYLSNIKKGDILMYRAGAFLWPDWDALGAIIRIFEGNDGQDRDGDGKQDEGYSAGDYTHCALVESVPDPDAQVTDLKDGIFKITETKKNMSEFGIFGKWDGETIKCKRLVSNTGVRVHATWPCVRQDSIDWENPHMEVWRIKKATPETIAGMLKLADDMLASGAAPAYQYDPANFVTFGNLRLPNARICSQFVAEHAYYASMLLGEHSICLTPDIAKNRDMQITPNDIINSGEVMRIRYQGLKVIDK